ncbi:MAG: hypothetical protein ABIJ31_02150 [Pseudomonadota bacterium]
MSAFSFGNAEAITINYTTTNLADGGTGDLWQYDYTVSDYSFSEFDEFTILFDYNLYDLLSSLNTLPDWDIYTLQSDPGIQEDGVYGSMALTENASSGVFCVSFIWLGSNNTPGAQPFEIYDENFEIISQGFTESSPLEPVPEPGTKCLFFVGLLIFIYTKKTKTILGDPL